MSLKESLKEILGPIGVVEHAYLKINKITNGFELEYGKMYDAPPLNFATLSNLADLFGTREIDVDNYSSSGCDTCDYGSDYGHTIQITNLTKNQKELEGLVGQGDIWNDKSRNRM